MPTRRFLRFIRFVSGLCIFLFLGIQISFAQLETNCENSNFGFGDFSGWEGCYGTFIDSGLPAVGVTIWNLVQHRGFIRPDM